MAGIDNLGKYGQITNAAKAAGGVDNLIHNVEKTAVSNAALGLRVQGAGIGVGVIGILARIQTLSTEKASKRHSPGGSSSRTTRHH